MRPQSTITQQVFGIDFTRNYPIPCVGIIIAGSENTYLHYLGVARKDDQVVSQIGGKAPIIKGSTTVKTNFKDNARIGDPFKSDQYLGTIIEGWEDRIVGD